MNCTEFQDVLPEIIDGSKTQEQQFHLRTCPACSSLVSDLNTIAQSSRVLRDSDDPSPRVWATIEIALRQEGLIREPESEPFVVPSRPHRWSLGWLVPVAATLFLAAAVVSYQVRSHGKQIAGQSVAAPVASSTIAMDVQPEDQQLLAVVESQGVSTREAYRTDLQNVNAYIRDAEQSLKNDPTDEEAQQSLMAAYEQKAMVYQMALDRSEP